MTPSVFAKHGLSSPLAKVSVDNSIVFHTMQTHHLRTDLKHHLFDHLSVCNINLNAVV